MARPRRKGLDYFPFDLEEESSFNSTLKILQLNHDSNFAYVFMHEILKMIYKENGYYLAYDFNIIATILEKSNLVKNEKNKNKFKNILKDLIENEEITFFDKEILREKKVFTSKEIQLRYVLATMKRSKNLIKKSLLIIDEEDLNEQGIDKKYYNINENLKWGYYINKNKKDTQHDSFGEKTPHKIENTQQSKVKVNESKEESHNNNHKYINKDNNFSNNFFTQKLQEKQIINIEEEAHDFDNKIEEMKTDYEIDQIKKCLYYTIDRVISRNKKEKLNDIYTFFIKSLDKNINNYINILKVNNDKTIELKNEEVEENNKEKKEMSDKRKKYAEMLKNEEF